MSIASPQNHKKIPLRLILVLPFVLQIFAAVGLVGYLSFKNGQRAVNELAQQLMGKTGTMVDQHLDSYIGTSHKLNKLTVDALKAGLFDLK
jgi:hypothetical protein